MIADHYNPCPMTDPSISGCVVNRGKIDPGCQIVSAVPSMLVTKRSATVSRLVKYSLIAASRQQAVYSVL